MPSSRKLSPIARGGLILVAFLLVLPMAGCLDIEADPNAISAEAIRGEGAFQSRLIGSASDFAVGVSYAAVYGGLFTDELIWGGSFVRRHEIDRRAVEPANDVVADEPYTGLQIAVATASSLQEDILDGAFPNSTPDPANAAAFAQVSFFAGYGRLYLADLFCTLAFDNTGPEINSSDVYALAIEDFTRTIDAGDAPAQIRGAALVGRARAYLQIGNTAQALADAQDVPEGFTFPVEYSGNSGRETNQVWQYTLGNRRLVVDQRYWDAPTVDDTNEVDPRIGVVATGASSFSGAYPLWTSLGHSSRSSPLTVASWEEAQFIIAEVEGGETAVDIMNDLRQRHGINTTLDFSDFASNEEILAKLAEEKARTLLLQGHRMGDSRRFLDLHAIDLFPTGPDHEDQTCMPLPDKERNNNPGLSG